MQSYALTPKAYMDGLPPECKTPMRKLRATIRKHLPKGFKECMSYGMLGYVVPHSLYPPGYHCNPSLPLPFVNLASQKNFIAIYHMGIYADPELNAWFKAAYAERVTGKLDMGKSCIRFKNIANIPFELIGELCTKMSVQECIAFFEKAKR